MATPYVGEIKLFGGNFPPAGWMFCDGSLLPISEYETLFELIGTTYGGDGESTFALPDLRGRIPAHMGGGFTLAETFGTETVTVTTSQIPSHTHAMLAASGPTTHHPANAMLAAEMRSESPIYNASAPDTAMAATAIGSTGGSQPHENRMPYLAVAYVISLFGIFPSQT